MSSTTDRISNKGTHLSKRRSGFVHLTRMLAAIVLLGPLNPAWAFLTDGRAPWPDEATGPYDDSTYPPVTYEMSPWYPMTHGGQPIRDPEVVNSGPNASDDDSHGSAAPSDTIDIASGAGATGVTPTNGNCNPTVPAGNLCGEATSAFFAYGFDTSGVGDPQLQVLYMRVRIRTDPTNGQSFENSKWNFLFDDDGVSNVNGLLCKEFWFVVNGNFQSNATGPDELEILFEDGDPQDATHVWGADNCQQVDNNLPANGTMQPWTDGVDPPYHTHVQTYAACDDQDDVSNGCGNDSDVSYSHTRAVPVPDDGSGNWYVDIQVPINAMQDPSTNCTAAGSGQNGQYCDPPRSPGNQEVTNDSALNFFFGTSDSNTDPLQKDCIGGGTGNAFERCVPGNSDTTPVTLSSFTSEMAAAGVYFTWTTETEFKNSGFNLYEDFDGAFRRINSELIPSAVIDSLVPQAYEYTAADAQGDLFWIEDVATTQETRRHGPFKLGKSYGQKDQQVDPIDWPSLKAEENAKAQARVARSKTAARGRFKALDRIKSRLKGLGATIAASVNPKVFSLLVSETGLYRVTYEDLASVDSALSGVNVRSLALSSGGESVPIRVVPNIGAFGPGGYIEFYGQAITDSLYTRTNVYKLQADRRKADRVSTDSKAPGNGAAPDSYVEAITVDDNNTYRFFAPGSDPWVNTFLIGSGSTPASKEFELDVDELASGPATLHAELWSLSADTDNPDHHVQVEVNGEVVADEYFDGAPEALSITAPLPEGLLVEGKNTVTFVLPMDLVGVTSDVIALDTYGVEYERRAVARNGSLMLNTKAQVVEVGGLGVSDPSGVVAYRFDDPASLTYLAQVAVSGGTARLRGVGNRTETYLVSTTASLLEPEIELARTPDDILSGQAQYLIVSHPSFIDELAPLVAARSSSWQVKVVDVRDVYSTFSGDIFDAQALKDYITYAIENMGTELVLLVGGDTYDYMDYLGLGSISFIPSLYVNLENAATFTPSDPFLTDVDGDKVPDAGIGRWPVRDAEELQTVMTKTLAYPDAGHGLTALYAADDGEGETTFADRSDALIDRLPIGWTPTSVYLDELDLDTARADLFQSLNNGSRLTTYVGHSGPYSWTFDGLLTSTDVATPPLNNGTLPTLISEWGCWNNYYVDPHANTLSHKLMTDGAIGAAAVIGQATITSAEIDGKYAPLLQDWLTTPGTSIGTAMLEAKRAVSAQEPGLLEIQLGTNLLGDPGLVVTP